MSPFATDSLERLQATAREILGQLDHPDATPRARRELLAMLTEIGYTGRLDAEKLEHAVRSVFEPGHGQIRRAVGHPEAPFTSDAMIDTFRARLAGVHALNAGQVTDEAFMRARQIHLIHYADYARQQPALVAGVPQHLTQWYQPATVQDAFTNCCIHLLTALGLEILYSSGDFRSGREE
jgi:hypothetical protein